MGCGKLIVLVLVCLVNEMASEPRLRLSWGRRRRYCHKTNCVPGSWSSWSACSHSCGPHGTQYSRRSIIKPAQCGGTCLVTTHGARACNRFCLNGGTLVRSSCHCKYGHSGECCEKGHGKDSGWSSWSSWGQCSNSCGAGLKTRKRSCTNPPPSYGGKTCAGPAEQHKSCLLKTCSDGGWSSWSSWGQCAGYCGTGLQTRKRSCTNPPPGYGGKKCVGPAEQHKNCLLHRCPVNGGWSNWGAWGKCSKTCGVGYQQSKRYCNNPRPEYGGKKCTGDKIKTRSCSVKSCAVDGGWSTWGPWSKCSKTCGYGSQYSKRFCTNPSPGYGGKPCTGKDTRTRGCLVKSCPVNGGWSSWGKWCTCSKPCGTGSQYRTRACTRPPPSYEGKQCTGQEKETRHCNTHHCPVDGGWSNWANWGTCTRTCGNGKQYSKRRCDNPAPKYGGKKCYGANAKTRACNLKPCPKNGRWSLWAAWSACTKTCGTGSKTRHRTCTNPPPKHGGVCIGLSVQTKTCVKQNCPVNGGWGTWGKWGACSKACGTGKQYRSRHCNKPTPAYGGKYCSGKDKESRNCNTNPCPVNGRWALWEVWSTCSKTCGYGTRLRKRTCSNPPPQNGGKMCTGPSQQTGKCYLTKTCPINGRWSPWGKWCKCSKTCGTGIQTRKRSCSNPPPQHEGKPCKGISEQTKSCQLKQCPGYGGWGSWGHWSACTKPCGTGTQNRKRTCLGSGNCPGSNEESRHCNTQSCPVDGGWGDWSDWSACSVSCGPGTSIRSRQCNNPAPSAGGKQCTGLPVGNKPCNEGSCPVDGGWGDWSDWSACSVSCGPGTSIRSRQCNNPAPSAGGKQCTGLPVGNKPCNEGPCPVDGGWRDWSDWSACSVSCGPGTSIRSRQCNNPAPSAGGKQCAGLPVGNKPCNEGPCPVDGGWGDWSDWSACSVSCGPGTSIRSRQCNNPAPSAGGKQCTGLPVGNKPCNAGSCPVDGGWGDWTDWSACSASCGPGTSIRSRQCNNPPPGPGGKQCTGLPVGNRLCNEGTCPASGDCWGDWSDWSMCTKACDCGKAYRVRFCNCAHGQGHEKCPGPGESSQSCNCNPCPNGPPSDDVVEE